MLYAIVDRVDGSRLNHANSKYYVILNLLNMVSHYYHYYMHAFFFPIKVFRYPLGK